MTFLEGVDIKLVLTSLLIALSVFALGLFITLWVGEAQKRKVRRRLESLERPLEATDEAPELLRDESLSSVPFFDALLHKMKLALHLETMLLQADLSMKVGPFLLIILLSGAIGGLVALALSPWAVVAIPAALITGSIPLVVVHRKRVQRLRKFERQFPDALDLMTGALRAGMAFTGALQVVAEESPDPVSKEFTIVFEEHRLGLGLREALESMLRRVDSNELRLFVTAVLLQRDMGGNLAEILEGTAAVIRDRFRILGDVRTITAQARLSGVILSLLPIAMAVVITIIAPEYLRILIEDPIGPYMIGAAVFLQVVGYFSIRRIINIRV